MANKPISCVFMGSDPIVMDLLKGIHLENDELSLDAVFTQPDRRSGRGKKLTENEIKQWVNMQDIPLFQPEHITAEIIEQFRQEPYQLVIVMAYGHIIPKALLEIPEFGFYNLHASLLPALRGASPIETAIVSGFKETGVTLMKMASGLDSGPILDQEHISISAEQNALELRNALAKVCYPLLSRNLKNVSSQLGLHNQDKSQATYCRIIDKQDGYIDWSLTAEEVLDHIRGFYPWPGAIVDLDGVLHKIHSARETTPDHLPKHAEAGSYQIENKTMHIKAADEWLEILEIQKPGARRMDTQAFLNGTDLPAQGHTIFPKRYPLIQPKYFKKPT